jgi:hypothetical protein
MDIPTPIAEHRCHILQEEKGRAHFGPETTMSISDIDDRDLYAILNVSRANASTADIVRSYRQLSRVFHPDKLSSSSRHEDTDVSDDDPNTTFVAIKQARDVLSDPVLRLAYDIGGIQAVTLIKRSQSESSHRRHPQPAAASYESNTDDDDYDRDDHDDDDSSTDQKDLYSELQAAPSLAHAESVIQQALDEYRWQQQQAPTRSQLISATLKVPLTIGEDKWELRPDQHVAFSFLSKRQVANSTAISVSASSTVQSTAKTDMNTALGIQYQPTRGTVVSVDTTLNHTNDKNTPHVSIRTWRKLGDGTLWVAAVAGKLQYPLHEWNYSLASFRNLQWQPYSTKRVATATNTTTTTTPAETTKLQASWRIGLRPGGVQQVVVSLKTVQLPIWRCRLALAGPSRYPFKVSYQTAERDTPYLAYSLGLDSSRLKIVWIRTVTRNWTCKFGIKYDGRAAASGTVFSIPFQLCSDEWTLHLPIRLFHVSTSSLWVAMLSIVTHRWVEQLLHYWIVTPFRASSSSFWWQKPHKKARIRRRPVNESSHHLPSCFGEPIARVAAKKRDMEKAANGLIVVRASWLIVPLIFDDKSAAPASTTVDVTDVLQFWVSNGRLHLPLQERRWWRSSEYQEESTLIWNNWYSLILRQLPWRVENVKDAVSALNIRYQFGKHMYDVSFHGDERIWLPNARATKLGNAETVS